ncbi:MAG: tripartite tricarboxylate transporter substrate binding protein [Betaproteobacteria bacterium]
MTLRPFTILRSLLAATVLAMWCALAAAQTYPIRPILFIVPLGVGSSTDIIARLVAQSITEETGEQVLVENRTGADGVLGTRTAVGAKSDGYTVLFSSSSHLINMHLYKSPGYDSIKDFVPVAPIAEFGMYLFVNANGPYKSMEDLLTRSRQQPGKLTYGTATALQRIMSELLLQRTGLKMVNVPYRATAAALTDLAAGGLIDAIFTDASSARALWQSGRIRPLAVGGQRRLDNARDVPTLEEAGVRGYDLAGGWFGAWVPVGTPAPVVARLNTLLSNAVKTRRVQESLATTVMQPLVMNPEEFARFQASEAEKLGRVVKAAGIEPQ